MCVWTKFCHVLLTFSHTLPPLALSAGLCRAQSRSFSLRNSPGTRIIFTKVSCFYFVHLRCFTKKKKPPLSILVRVRIRPLSSERRTVRSEIFRGTNRDEFAISVGIRFIRLGQRPWRDFHTDYNCENLRYETPGRQNGTNVSTENIRKALLNHAVRKRYVFRGRRDTSRRFPCGIQWS